MLAVSFFQAATLRCASPKSGESRKITRRMQDADARRPRRPSERGWWKSRQVWSRRLSWAKCLHVLGELPNTRCDSQRLATEPPSQAHQFDSREGDVIGSGLCASAGAFTARSARLTGPAPRGPAASSPGAARTRRWPRQKNTTPSTFNTLYHDPWKRDWKTGVQNAARQQGVGRKEGSMRRKGEGYTRCTCGQ